MRRLSRNSGSLNPLKPQWPIQTCTGTVIQLDGCTKHVNKLLHQNIANFFLMVKNVIHSITTTVFFKEVVVAQSL